MKQFLNVLKFELGNYFKSRSFMVTTVLLALVVAAAVALPPVFMKGSFSMFSEVERKATKKLQKAVLRITMIRMRIWESLIRKAS
ncbi:MAG: hypothetical protein ACLS5R_05490 [Blautia sp.]